MGVYIPTMDAPDNCCVCPLRQYGDGEEYCPFTQVECLSIGRQDACPIIQVVQHKELRPGEIDVYAGIFDCEEVYPNCTVQVLSNSVTGNISIGWWENE